MLRRRRIVTINQNTKDVFDHPTTSFFKDTIYIPDKPCRIIKCVTKLQWQNNMEINVDKRANPTDPAFWTTWNHGDNVSFLIYKGENFSQDADIFPDTNNAQNFFKEGPLTHLLDYGHMRFDRAPTDPRPELLFFDLSFDVIGGIIGVGPVAAPGGVGTVGPFSLDFVSTDGSIDLSPDTTLRIPQFGGTTVDTYKEKTKLDIKMNGSGDYIRFTGLYRTIPHVNTGGKLFGTIELIIEF